MQNGPSPALTLSPGATWVPGTRRRETRLFQSGLISLVLGELGALALALANGTAAPLVVFTVSMAALVGLLSLFRNVAYERRALVLTFATCVLAGGAAQLYAQSAFSALQTTPDADFWYEAALGNWTGRGLAEIDFYADAPLAVLIWSWLYKAAALFNLGTGLWVGVMFNALLVGLSAALTVRMARDIYGDAPHVLWRVGTMFAGCGYFWLYGGLFVRDGYVLLVHTLILYVLLFFVRKGVARGGLALVLMIPLSAAAVLIRDEEAKLVPLMSAIALMSWLFSLRGWKLVLGVFATVGLVGAMNSLISAQLGEILAAADDRLNVYRELAILEGGDSGLGYAFIVSQPLPVRLVLGAFTMHMSPIPLWRGFVYGSPEYVILKNAGGIFVAFFTPAAVVGALRAFRHQHAEARPLILVLFFALVGLLGVVATSLELRHYGTFLCGFILLAVYPLYRPVETKRLLGLVTRSWWAVAIVAHLVWLLFKL